MKKISLIIPVYNCEEYLDDCFKSIENQTMSQEDFEVIIINDGSKDNSLEIINKYAKNNNWTVINQKNSGAAAARNCGLDVATGEFITFFDSDDILENDALENMYDEIIQNKAEVGLFKTHQFNSKGVFDDYHISLFNKLEKMVTTLNNNLELAKFIRIVAILYKRELLKDIRFIPYGIHEDNYFCIKAYDKAERIFVSSTYVYKVRKREGENLSVMQNLNLRTYKHLHENVVKADTEIKNDKLVKIHGNQLFGYIKKDIPKNDIYEAKLLLFDYLDLMKKNKIINLFAYLKLEIFFKLKYFVKVYPVIFRDKLKLRYLSCLTLISPKLNTKIFYKKRIGKDINLNNPVTFNEKIQWLKLNYLYPNKLVTKCADKVEARNYIKENDCEEILTDVIGIYNNVEEIKFADLPNKFVLKWNFGCGYNIICQDKTKLNINVTKKILKKWGKSKFHLYNSELHYKDIKRKLICEKFIEPQQGILPEDYKFYCFDGKASYVMICYEREKGKPKFYFFDRDWNLARINIRGMNAPEGFTIPKPKKMDKMFEYADKLSKNFPFVRVDLYNVEDKIYFGELTFTPSAGLDTAYTDEGQIILGNKITIKE